MCLFYQKITWDILISKESGWALGRGLASVSPLNLILNVSVLMLVTSHITPAVL